ncbi:proline-rich receptor-like protein kinase PERK2 isoform X1 [Arachis duranensis]|uniref:non-specific serine/threonine protein kinase n=2 Tax=Arachis TaxID=3817 RepID=A0A445B4B1_ARAHY|nr:proline-rich receptor-like protein kinase PERK2 isoform X1 [Arachis duranensis]QHO16866.1 Proline-rich receptor-like protein kinase [Arachis hypogaea]RYR33513.1 hypothetical protein Ahy_A10g048124 isoform A [Arachis hypogaea]
MFSVAPLTPASSPVMAPPSPPLIDITPPPSPLLLQPTAAPPPFPSPPSPPLVLPMPTAPPLTSPPITSPPEVVSLPTNSPPPVTQVPPAISSSPPPPEIPIVAASPSTPITSNENPIPATQSPPNTALPAAASPPVPATPLPSSPPSLIPPSVTFPSNSLPPLPLLHRKVSPALPVPTATSPPPQRFWPLAPEAAATSPLLPQPPATVYPFTEPTLPSTPEATPAQPPSSRSLPLAVDVDKHSGFEVPSGFIIEGIVIGGIVIGFVVALMLLLFRNRKKKQQQQQKNLHTHQSEESSPCVGAKKSESGSHVIKVLPNPSKLTEGGGDFGPVNGIFTYDELVAATKSFSEANLLGEGGFGYVYKGILPSGKEIAVKQLKSGSQQGEREFQAEVETISRVHHKHLVELVGYCVTMSERMLVYEFVPNNTLEFHLHGEGKPVVRWEKRIKIALGSAKGLAYLHEDCNPAIIHRDIKASNILLDFNFEAKVSDFGLAKIFPNNADGCITHLTTRVVGTFGYLAPEYASSGKLTDKSDVYSYGVMLLELLTGRPAISTEGSRNVSLVDWARPLLAQVLEDGDISDLVDPRLQNNYKADEMTRMITCAAACVRHSASLRPRMSQIAGALEGLVSLSDLVGDITPGHTRIYSWPESSTYDACQYQQDLRDFNLGLSSQQCSSSVHSEMTSAYGLCLSDSSSEG